MRVPGEGPTLALTLDDAVKLALERNLDIVVQRLSPQLQDIAMASAQAFYNPSVTSTFARAAATGTPSNQLQLSSGGRGVTQNQLAVNGGIVQNFRWGGATLAATLNNGRFQSDSNNALFNPQFNSNWTAVFSQPLMRGFRIDAQRTAAPDHGGQSRHLGGAGSRGRHKHRVERAECVLGLRLHHAGA